MLPSGPGQLAESLAPEVRERSHPLWYSYAMAKPPVPEYRSYFNPTLQALKALGGSATIEELNARVALDMKLPEEVLVVPHDPDHGGISEVAYRIAWARSYLKAAGFITNSSRGVWSLTPGGIKVDRVDEKQLARDVQVKYRGAKKPRETGRDEAEEQGGEGGETVLEQRSDLGGAVPESPVRLT